MDPFIPIEVTPYSKFELDTVIDYFLEKKYLSKKAGTEAGRAEMQFLTGRNPKDFTELSSCL